MRKKILLAVLSLTVVAASFAGCAGRMDKADNTAAPANTPAAKATAEAKTTAETLPEAIATAVASAALK